MLDALIDGIRGTGGRTVLLLGAPGIGKSALLAHAVTHASAAGFTI
jgi:ATP-dependent 26S proteasome regulatory subunit